MILMTYWYKGYEDVKLNWTKRKNMQIILDPGDWIWKRYLHTHLHTID